MSEPSISRVLPVVALGGALGSLARWGVSEAVDGTGAVGDGFPWATFLVNVTGCLALGVLIGWLADRPSAPWWVRPLVALGFLGGFTTFSTYALDARDLSASGHSGQAALALVAGVAAGLLAVTAGLRVGRAAGGRGWVR